MSQWRRATRSYGAHVTDVRHNVGQKSSSKTRQGGGCWGTAPNGRFRPTSCLPTILTLFCLAAWPIYGTAILVALDRRSNSWTWGNGFALGGPCVDHRNW